MRALSYILLIALLSSCQTIRFVKNNKSLEINSDNIGVSSRLYHIGLYGFHEYSDPVSPKRICGKGKFAAVEIYFGFKEVLIQSIGALTGGLLPALYSPRSVEVTCKYNQKR